MSISRAQVDQLSSDKLRLASLLLKKKGICAPQAQVISRRFSSDPPPLSFSQQRMWFLDRLEPGLSIYNVFLGVSVNGILDAGALERSLNEIVRRHEVLRTTFATADDQPVQIIARFEPACLPIVDLTCLDRPARDVKAQQLANEEAQEPFNLSKGPVLRVKLLRLEETEHVLLICMHHIATDGRAMGIFISELICLYKAFSRDEPSPLPELPIQYSDYAVWQRERLSGEALEAELKYWEDHLRGMAPVLEVPTSWPRPAVRTYTGAVESLTLSRRLSEGVKLASKREAATQFMTLLACFKALLYRYTGQEDIVVGTPVANRNRPETEGLIGLLVNTLILRTDLGGRPTLKEVIKRVKKVVEEAQAHQDVPFEKLVEHLQPERSSGHTPMFQLMFVMQDAVEKREEAEGLKLSTIGGTSETAKFDLSMFAQENNGRLTIAAEYNTQLYEPAMVRLMLGHMQKIIEAMVGDCDQPVSAIEILDEKERRYILQQCNGLNADHLADYLRDKRAHRMFEEHAQLNPTAVAIVDGQASVTYQELDWRANDLARHLQRLGVGSESIVAVCAERSIEMIVGVLAALKAGGAYLPLDPNYPAERLAFILEDAGAKILLTQRHLLEGLPSQNRNVLCLDDLEQFRGDGAPCDDVRTGPENLAYVIYTSGSTGQPKGVQVQHGSLTNLIEWHQRAFEVTALDRATQLAGLAFDASVWELWPYLAAGASIYLPDKATLAEPRRLIDWLVINGVTISFLPTPLAEAVMQESWPAQAPLRLILTGGDKLHRVSNESLPFKLINNYGPTENTVVATSGEAQTGADQSRDPIIGKPIDNVQAYLLDEHLGLAPQGIPAELVIGGDGLARGYLNSPELTAEKFIPDPFKREAGARLYKTGDVARLLFDGGIEFLGRKDYQVKIRGFRIELGEIEAALSKHAAVRETVVLAREDARGDKRLIAYFIPDNGTEVTNSELRSFVKARVPDYMVPYAFVPLERLPLTQNGKVDRNALPAIEGYATDTNQVYLAPRDALELELSRIWEEVLCVERVGVRDNFFSLGGHSLLAVRLMNRVENLAGKPLPVSLLFQEATVEHLAGLVRQQSELEFSPLVQIQKGNRQPPFFCVHPAGGNVLCYASLAHHLGTEQTFYGLQARGLDRTQAPHTDIAEMATYYINALKQAQPHGPYFLGGWSIGGIVAFEMTQQLLSEGEPVALLALIDTVAPTHYDGLEQLDEVGLILNFAQDLGISLEGLNIPWEVLADLDVDAQWSYLLQQALAAGVVPPDFGPAHLRSLFNVFKANCDAVKRYVPRSSAGRVILLQAEKQAGASRLERADEWRRWVGSELEVNVVPGNHFTMVREPDVKMLAESLRGHLARALENV
jgi:amino acid adenylation domain-containing protein